ncbi:uncharacterized protein LOC129589289 isoform X2 [Paramacrobiotus metropolitanus]|uniref:uncharacterized protein LOC129589289 isoform X2 n=1 Tax=Paramacrobiotus metropolitanus TaxID=2943436 RepID=UPI00244600E6|nr:uncharacterized protein LOC129589289 isoform X2 [Paramacrobiotus metropolitanus]
MSAFLRRLRSFFGLFRQIASVGEQELPQVGEKAQQAPIIGRISLDPHLKSAEVFGNFSQPVMASVATKIANLKPHVPLIRFRYRKDLTGKNVSGLAAPSTKKDTSPSTASSSRSPMTAFDEPPSGFKRLPISEEEIFAINTGGVPFSRPAKAK